MSIVFRIRDFAYPLSILQLKRTFDRNQWLSEEALAEYQSERLRKIIAHAYDNIPYYQRLFRKHDIRPGDIRSWKDLKQIPFLTKDLLKENFSSLVARNAKKFRPLLLSTSGTTGGKVSFYVDKPSNVLEFVYYWRFWGWAGYKLGDTFVTLSSEYFAYHERAIKNLYRFHKVTRSLIVNSMFLSPEHQDEIRGIFIRFKPRFLTAHPLNIYRLALLFHRMKDHGIQLQAIFSQGANLQPYQRELMEKVFSCKVYDSYGHMERTMVISQCPFGSYHVHTDYGLLELENPGISVANSDDGETCIREVVGTSLHNFAMPLIRYRTGDFVRIKSSPGPCACKRGFPTIVSVIGREIDIVTTPDRRKIVGLYLVFGHTPGIVMGQIIQEKIDHLHVKIVCEAQDPDQTDRILKGHIRKFVGDDMKITIEYTTVDGITKDSYGKFKTVVSHIRPEEGFD